MASLQRNLARPRRLTPGTLAAVVATGLLVTSWAPSASAAPLVRDRTSTSIAGYGVTHASAARDDQTRVDARFVVPQADCGAEDSTADIQVELTSRRQAAVSGVRITCTGGQASYQGFYDKPSGSGVFIGENVHPGQTLALVAGLRTPGHLYFALQVKGRGYEVVKSATSKTWAAPRIVVHASSDQPMTNFGAVTFTHCRFGTPPQTQYQMRTADGLPRADTSSLVDHAFTVTWMHA
jgi:Peptidase A4 family